MQVNRSAGLFYRLVGLWFSVLAIFAAPAAADDVAPLEVLAFGDSLTVGYGLGPGEGFSEKLQAWLNDNMDRPVRVVNGGVSGDTSSGGRSRLGWALAGIKGGAPDLVILELGANDGLRGIDPTITRDNIDAMVKDLRDKGVRVLVAGMMAPPNLGPDYAATFNPIFADTAKRYGATLYPFFLDGVAADASLNQSDGMHPNEDGVKIIVERIGPVVKAELLR